MPLDLLHPDLCGGLVLLALTAFILWVSLGLPVPRGVRAVLGEEEDER